MHLCSELSFDFSECRLSESKTILLMFQTVKMSLNNSLVSFICFFFLGGIFAYMGGLTTVFIDPLGGHQLIDHSDLIDVKFGQ